MVGIQEQLRVAILRGQQPDLLLAASDKIERQRIALVNAKAYIEAQIPTEAAENALAIIDGVLL